METFREVKKRKATPLKQSGSLKRARTVVAALDEEAPQAVAAAPAVADDPPQAVAKFPTGSPDERRQCWKEFTADLLLQLRAIGEEVQPTGDGAKRQFRRQSPTIWAALDKHFGLRREDLGARATDLSTLRGQLEADVRRGEHIMTKEILDVVCSVATVAHLPPYHSLRSWFPPVNNAARETYGDGHPQQHLIASFMRPREEQHLMQRRAANDGVVRRNRQGIRLHYSQVRSVVYNWAHAESNDPDYIEKLHLALMAAIGTRKTGLLDPRIRFTKTQTEGRDDRFWIRQVGVLKDKMHKLPKVYEEDAASATSAADEADAMMDDDTHTQLETACVVEKPIVFGFTSEWVLQTVETIRAARSVSGLTRQQMGARYGPSLVRVVKEAFADALTQHKRLGTHFLRALYANVAYHYFEEQVGDSLTSFISTVLAHNNNSLNTALSYQTVKISYDLKAEVSADVQRQTACNRESIQQVNERLDKFMQRMAERQTAQHDEAQKRALAHDAHLDLARAALLAHTQELALAHTSAQTRELSEMPPRKRIRESRKLQLASVRFLGTDREEVTVHFHRRSLKSSDKAREEEAREAVRLLRTVPHMKVNAQMLRDLGFGSKTALTVLPRTPISKVKTNE